VASDRPSNIPELRPRGQRRAPSLLPAGASADDEGPVSILAALGESSAPYQRISGRRMQACTWPRRGVRRALMVGGGAVVGVALILALGMQVATSSSPHTDAAAELAEGQAPFPGSAAPATVRHEEPLTPLAELRQGARIETLDLHADVASASDQPALSPAVAGAPTSHDAETAATTFAARTAAPSDRQRTKSPAKPSPVPATRSASSRSNDADALLIAALMTSPRFNDGARDFPAKVPGGRRSIADLVRSCERLPDAQATGCREQICTGYWGKAEACSLVLAPAPR